MGQREGERKREGEHGRKPPKEVEQETLEFLPEGAGYPLLLGVPA